MKKSINYLHILFVEICMFLLPLSAWGQQRVVISPFYSDYALLTDSLSQRLVFVTLYSIGSKGGVSATNNAIFTETISI